MAQRSNVKDLGSLKQEGKLRKCPECGCEDIGYENGELYCKKCGYVLD
jgi:membrane protease subunit (stomatin/prohibitin family)